MSLRRDIVLKTAAGLRLELRMEISDLGSFSATACLRRQSRTHGDQRLCFSCVLERNRVRLNQSQFSGHPDLWIAGTSFEITEQQRIRAALFLTEWDALVAETLPTADSVVR